MRAIRNGIFFTFLIFTWFCSFSQNPADSVLANQYFAKGDSLLRGDQFLNSADHFRSAAELYKKIKNWEKLVHSLNKISQCYRRYGDYKEAGKYNQRVRSLCAKYLDEEHAQMAIYYSNSGHIHKAKGNYQPALEDFKKALEIKQKSAGGGLTGFANSYNDIGLAFYRLELYDSSLFYHHAALDLESELNGPNSRLMGHCKLNIGNIYYMKRNYDLAQKYYYQALSTHNKTLPNQSLSIALCLMNIGFVNYQKGNFDLALDFLQRALLIRRKTLKPNHPRVARCLHFMGSTLQAQGKYNKALDYFQRSLDMKKEIYGEDHRETNRDYYSIGICYRYIGAHEKALEHNFKALDNSLKAFGQYHPDIIRNYNAIGNAYKQVGEYDLAIEYFEKCLSLSEKVFLPYQIEFGWYNNNLGEAYGGKGDYQKAADYMNKALRIKKKTLGLSHPSTISSTFKLGRIYSGMGKMDLALQYYQEAICANIPDFQNSSVYANPPLNKSVNQNHLLKCLQLKALELEKRYLRNEEVKDLIISLETYQLADTLIGKIRKSNQRFEDKVHFAQSTDMVYKGAVRVCNTLFNLTRDHMYNVLGFYFAERNKDAILRQNFTDNRAKKIGMLPDSIIQSERTLKVDQSYYQSRVIEFENSNHAFDSIEYITYQNRLFETNYRLDSLTEWLEESYPRYYDIKYRNNILSVEDAQNKLDNGQLVLSYFEEDSAFYAFAITKTNFQVHHIKKDEKLKLHIKQYRNSLDPDFISSDPAKAFESFTSSSNHLHNRLVAPNLDQLTHDIDHLIIIPDGDLANIPWDIFTTAQASVSDGPDYASLRYLLNDYSISYGHSVSLLFQDFYSHAGDPENSVLAFAPTYPMDQEEVAYENLSSEFRDELVPLTWNLSELEEISKYFTGNFLSGSSATEKVFKKEAGNYRILHLAMHALVDHENPMLSSLVFTHVPDSLEDAMLQTHELFNMELSADMVVLSACNTGIGKMQKGEGIMSLGRGFSYAGCPSVVMSHWSVDDRSTSELMGAFYRHIAEGLSKDKALRQAKLDFLSSAHGQQTHPYYWGSFVVTGNAGPLLHSKNNQWLYLLILSIVIGFVIFFYWYGKIHSLK